MLVLDFHDASPFTPTGGSAWLKSITPPIGDCEYAIRHPQDYPATSDQPSYLPTYQVPQPRTLPAASLPTPPTKIGAPVRDPHPAALS